MQHIVGILPCCTLHDNAMTTTHYCTLHGGAMNTTYCCLHGSAINTTCITGNQKPVPYNVLYIQAVILCV